MLALVSSELAERDRWPLKNSLDRTHRPQARSVKGFPPILFRSEEREDQFEHLGALQTRVQRQLPDETELSYAANCLEMCTTSIVHEVNQPLSAIVTNAETCLRRLDRAEPDLELIRELVRRVIVDARRASEIVVGVSDMAKGKTPRYRPLQLNAIIEESIASLRHEFQSREVAVSLDLTSNLPAVEGDRIQLQQVVVNLLVNAAQAMSTLMTGRSISIRTVLSSHDIVHCSIEDAGPGIEPAHLPHLFGHSFTTKVGGKGIGLQISRSIVEAHGGWIKADNHSSLGGARFTFTLPASIGD